MHRSHLDGKLLFELAWLFFITACSSHSIYPSQSSQPSSYWALQAGIYVGTLVIVITVEVLLSCWCYAWVGISSSSHFLFLHPCSGNAGSGLCVFSKFPIVAVRTHPFLTHKGMFDVAALSNEILLGKVCLSCRLKTPAGYIRLFVLHVRVHWVG